MNYYASIDIGTNTILLTIASYSYGVVRIIEDIHNIARLGEDLNQKGFISENAIERANSILSYYSKYIDNYAINGLYLTATSAMRNASNSENVKLILEDAIGHKISIISGEEEAKLTLLGSLEKDQISATIIDIGGGSTEIITGEVNDIKALISLPIGVVYLKYKYILYNKYKILQYKDIRQYTYDIILNNIDNVLKNNVIAVAGTPTTLATIYQGLKDFQIDKIHGFLFKKEMLDNITEKLIYSSVEDIIKKFHVHPGRADVIAIGAIILQTFMEIFDIKQFSVSARGLRYGALKYIISQKENIDMTKISII